MNLNLNPLSVKDQPRKKLNRAQKSSLSKYSPCTRSELTTPRLKGRKESGHKSFDLAMAPLTTSQEVKKEEKKSSEISKEDIYAAILDFPPKIPSSISIFEPEQKEQWREEKEKQIQKKKRQEIEELIVKERRVSRSPKRKQEEMPLQMS